MSLDIMPYKLFAYHCIKLIINLDKNEQRIYTHIILLSIF